MFPSGGRRLGRELRQPGLPLDAGPGRDAREQTDTRIRGALQPPGLKRREPLQMEAWPVSRPSVAPSMAAEWERKGGWREPREGGRVPAPRSLPAGAKRL